MEHQGSLQDICAPRTKSALVQECGDALEQLARQKEVALVWVPGHIGVPVNERTDELARSESTGSRVPSISRR
ncbi:hypothetical protein NQ317_007977 [Molorchus minor]|uniref:RNase H type-1 domain-containing protein n=1 Tax=Molorchus minor TaxID=1323400 RepID=A0ABQ9J1K3_9CUCU|nr:hypothetical protein NQ317_007977 [Molorchus minor]